MSVDFYRKLSWIFGLLALGVFLGLAAFSATVEVKDLDLWLHLRSGEYIATHGFVPTFDVFSCSALGLPWNNHEWLFQLLLHGVRSFAGMDGLIYMQAGIVVLTFLLLLVLTYRHGKQLLILPLFYLCLLVYQTRFTIRPDIFSILFTVIFVYVLSRGLSRRRAIWFLFGLEVLWVNMHGYFFIGVFLVGMVLAAETLKRRARLPGEWSQEGRLTDVQFRHLKWALAAVVAATVFNPQFITGALYPLKVLFDVSGDSRIFFNHITELRRPITWQNVGDPLVNWPLKALILISFLSFFYNRRRVNLSVLFIWLFFLGLSLLAVRNMTYFAFAAYLAVLANAGNIGLSRLVPVRFTDERCMYLTGAAAKIMMAIFLLNASGDMAVRGYYDFDRYERKSEFLGVDQRMFPHKAADFLIASGIKGNFFNDFNSGAYLIGRVYPSVRVYMDGRTELRGAKFFKAYRKIWDDGDEKEFDKAVLSYGLTGVFVNTAYAEGSENFLKMIAARKEWKVIYFDYDAVIFLKDIPVNRQAIETYAVDLAGWQPPVTDVKRLGGAPVLPYRYLNRAITLRSMGLNDQAVLEADRMLGLHPSSVGAYRIKGNVALDRKDYAQAYEMFRLGLSYAPDDRNLRVKMAEALLGTGDLEAALKEGEKITEREPENVEGYYIVAKAYAKSKKYQKAYDILLRALTLKPKTSEGLVIVGEIALNNKDLPWAEKFLTLAVSRYDQSPKAHEALGDLFAAQNQASGALKHWERSLSLKPENPELRKKLADFKR